MTIENENKEIQPEVEEIQVEVTDSESQEVSQDTSSEDELENYTKGVSKRINKLNARKRAAEEKAQALEQALQQKEAEVHNYYQHAVQAQQNSLAKDEELMSIKEREANELFKKAHESGDADMISKADSLKNEVSIQKEKVRIAKQRQEESYNQTQVQPQVQPQVQAQAQEQPGPTQEALDWASENKWFGENAEATQYAQFTHVNLINEGFEPDSNEYYNELNQRINKVYPDLKSDNAEKSEGRPAVQRVATDSVD